ncbi:MAG: beta-propeller domain-containing protein [Candidatus Hydrogenedentes bacterium]|nr:beta-propeller domain-containing protein [Candidatus Hydrogenedentota bacterium]
MRQAKTVSLFFLYFITLILCITLSCSNNTPPNIPDENTDTEYIEGNTQTTDGEITEGEGENSNNTDGEITEGSISSEGEEGEPSGSDNTFTSAVIFDSRDENYGEPEPTTEGGDSGSERDLIEPDVIRKLENYLFVLNQFRGLTIVDLTEKKVVSNVPLYGYPRDLYIKDKYAIVLIGYTISHTVENEVLTKTTGAKAIIIDLSNIFEPQILSSILLPGDFVDSRIVGNILYAVTSDYYYYYEYSEEVTDNTPNSSSWATEWGSRCWITSINISTPSSPKLVERIEFPGYGTVVQATNHSIYICIPDWNTGNTSISYIDISDPNGDITQLSSAMVPGYVSDRFKLDEWQNCLRVASNTSWNSRNTFITIFDVSTPTNIQLCSQIQLSEAQNETLYATRFAQNYLYLVTYLTIDPLFIVDLSDPHNPVVKGQLKVPGWSIHIEPMENNQLIALGVDDQDNQRRVKVSWFDVSDPTNPTEVSTVSIGEGWVWSSAYSDVKAFTIINDYIIVPFSGWLDNQYKERLQFIKSLWNEKSLLPLGYVDLRGQALRTIKHTDYFYSITTEYVHEITLNPEEKPLLTGVDIPIAEYTADVLEVNNSNNIIEIITDTEKSILTAQLKNNLNEILDKLEIKTSGYFFDATKISDDTIGVVLNDWNPNSSFELNYRVILLQAKSTNSIPKLEIIRDDFIPLTPIYYWWGYLEYNASVIRPYPYHWNYGSYVPNELLFVIEDKLILRGRGEKFDSTLGDETIPSEGFAIIDSAPENAIKTVGLGFSNIVNLIEAEGRIFLTTQKFIDSVQPPLTSYYLSEISLDPLNITEPVNVPGVITSANSSAGIYFLKDWQYVDLDNTSPPPYYYTQYETWFRSIEIVDGRASIIDSFNTKLSWAQFYPDMSNYLLYLNNQDNLLTLHKLDVSPDGKFTNYTEKTLGESLWGELIHCKKPYAYLAIDSASLVSVNLDTQPPIQILNLIPLSSYPIKYRVGNDDLYIIFGLGGWSKVKLLENPQSN